MKHKSRYFIRLNIKLTRVRPTPQIGYRVFVGFGTALTKKGVRKWKFSKCQHKGITYSLSRVSWEESCTKEGRRECVS